MCQNRNLNRYFEYCKSIIEEFLQAYEKQEQKDSTCLQCLHQEVEDNITVKDLLYEFPEELKSKYQLTPTVHVNFKDNTDNVNPALKEYAIMVILINPAQPARNQDLLFKADRKRYSKGADATERLKAHDRGIKHEYPLIKAFIKEYLNLKLDYVIVENLAKCPLKENLSKEQREEALENMVKCCFQHLKQQINLLQPDLIIAACKTYLDIELDSGETIEQALNKLGKGNIIILPHFRYTLLQVEDAYKQLLQQLKKHQNKLRKFIFEDQKLLEAWEEVREIKIPE